MILKNYFNRFFALISVLLEIPVILSTSLYGARQQKEPSLKIICIAAVPVEMKKGDEEKPKTKEKNRTLKNRVWMIHTLKIRVRKNRARKIRVLTVIVLTIIIFKKKKKNM